MATSNGASLNDDAEDEEARGDEYAVFAGEDLGNGTG